MEQYKGMGKSIRKASHLYSEWLSIESSTHGGRRRVVRGQAGREEAICSSKWGGSVVGEHLASRSHQGDHCEKIKNRVREPLGRLLETVWCLAIANKASHTNPLPRLELKLISLVSKLSRLQTAEESRLRNRHRFRLEKALSDRSIYFGFPIVIPVRRNKQVRDTRRFQSHANQ